MTRKSFIRSLLLCGAALSTFQGTAALAQSTDVVVMRRVLDGTKIVTDNTGPAPTAPVVSPTPTPTPVASATPAPTPAPTPQPTPEASQNPNTSWKASNLFLRSGGVPSIDAKWASISVENEVCWDSSISRAVSTTECTGKPRDPLVGAKTVPVAVFPTIRGIYLDVGDLAGIMPALSNLKSLCSSTYTLAGAGYGVRCTSDPASLDVVRVPLTAGIAPNNDPTTGITNVTFTSYECRDARTGERSDAPKCTGLPNTDDLQLETTHSVALRTFVIDAAEISARAPTVTGADKLCSTSAAVKVAGTSQSWKVRCDPAEIAEHYEKYATTASSVLQSYPFPNSQYQISTASAGVKCHDTSTGLDALDQSKCAFLTNPASVGLLSFASGSNPDNRTVVVTRDTILAQSPRIANLDAFCKSQVTVSTNGTNASWRMRCDPAALNEAFDSYVFNGAFITQELPTANMTYQVSTPKCRSLSTGEDVTTSFCDSLPDKYVTVQKIPVPILGTSRELRTIAIDPDEYRNLLNNQNLNYCSSSVAIYRTGTSGSTDSWFVRCGADELKEVYERRHTTLSGNVTPYPKVGQATTIAFRRNSEICWNTEKNAIETNTSKCSYITNSPVLYSSTDIPATFSDQLRRVLVNTDDVKKAYPWNTTNPCNQLVYVERSNSTTADGWRTVCNPDEVNPDNYERRYSTIAQPDSVSFDDTTVSFRRNGMYCWNKKISVNEDAGLCEYLTNSPANLSSTPIPAIFNSELRRVWIDKNAFDAAYPWFVLNVSNNPCSYTLNVKRPNSTSTDAWKTTCNKDDVDSSRYYSIATQVYPPSATARYPDVTSTVLQLRVGSINCVDKTTGQNVDTTTCAYLNAEKGPKAGEYFSIPSSTNTSLYQVTIKKSDVLAAHPNTTLVYICNNTSVSMYATAARTSTTTYKIVCQ